MYCNNCGNQIPDGSASCGVCGASFAEFAVTSTQATSVPQYSRPVLQFATDRSLLKMIFLSLITFGIYAMVIWSRIPDELNIAASRYDGRKTCPYFAMVYLTAITFGIFSLVWQHNFADRVGTEVKRRGYNYKFGSADFWLWNVLGSLIIIGPFVYIHKLMKSMNMINASYNMYG